MRANHAVRKITLRGILAGIKLAQVDKQAELTDSEVQKVVRKEIKAEREAILDAHKAVRPELVAEGEAKLKILEEFVPRQLGREEIAEKVRAVMLELGAAGPADLGRVMKVVQPQLKDLADGKTVGDVVRELLATK